MSIYLCNECNDKAFVLLMNGLYRDLKVYSKQNEMILTKEEVLSLLKVLEHEYIPYDNEHAHIAMRKMQAFVEKSNETKTNT